MVPLRSTTSVLLSGRNHHAMSFLNSLFGGGGKAKTELFTPPPPPRDEAVTHAETALGIRFPSSFISFMRESRAMQLPLCARFYWIGQESLGTSNIVAANRREREESASPLPSFLVAFYNDGMATKCVLTLVVALKAASIPSHFGITRWGQRKMLPLSSGHQHPLSRLASLL